MSRTSPNSAATLAGKTAVVTGGAAGIGRATAEILARHGATVVIADIDKDQGSELAESLTGPDRPALFCHVDMADVAGVRAMVDEATRLTGTVDILVNNAAVSSPIPMLEITEDDWDRVMNVNLRGLFFCLQATAEVMRTQGSGKIVNISAISGKGAGGTANVAYAASKAGVIMLTRSAAMVLGQDGINVNCVCPGRTDTGLLAQARKVNPNMHGTNAFTPVLNRMSQPSAIADAVFFLASPMADDITGQSINVDNGVVWD